MRNRSVRGSDDDGFSMEEKKNGRPTDRFFCPIWNPFECEELKLVDPGWGGKEKYQATIIIIIIKIAIQLASQPAS